MATAGELYGRPWSEREFIIVLHYYFEHRNEPRHAGCRYVEELSEVLGRTSGAILMRMENYASIDPDLRGARVGLININALGRRVFNEWCMKTDALRDCARAFIRDSKATNLPTLFDPHPVRVPKAFGKYELVDKIGEGAAGIVFSCINTNDNCPFAIKIIRTEGIYDPNVFHRFLREIHALKAVSHPNVINLYEDNLESERNFPAFVMDLAAHSLTGYAEEIYRGQDTLLRPVVPCQEAMCIIRSVLDAAEALHSNSPRLIHRDINPNNVLQLPDGRWALADFGLAKFLSTAPVSTSFRTTTERGWGTTWYAAPEQYNNFSTTDERSDIYSVGMLMWELFSSCGPPPSERDSGLDDAMEAVFRKATARDPSQRYATIRELREDLLDAAEKGR